MITISDEFMQQMLATTRKYCVVILKVGPKRNEEGVVKSFGNTYEEIFHSELRERYL
jgi:hypothetical protein